MCATPSLVGCTTALKHVYYELRGAKSKIQLIDELPEQALDPYQSVRFTPATTDIGENICPSALLHYFDEYATNLRTELREEYPGGTPGLVASTDVLYFQEKGLLSGALCLARVKLHDEDSNALVADFVVKTESKSFRQGSRHDLAESNVNALGKLLATGACARKRTRRKRKAAAGMMTNMRAKKRKRQIPDQAADCQSRTRQATPLAIPNPLPIACD